MPDTQLIIDTLQADTALVSQFQQSAEYDYHREFIEQDYSLIERIVRWLDELFNRSFSQATGDETSPYWVMSRRRWPG